MKRCVTISVLMMLCMGLLVPRSAAQEAVITVAATEWRPYMSEALPDQGIVVEITRVAFERAGYTAAFTFYPWKRLLATAQDGTVDAALGVSYTEDRAAYFAYPANPTFEDRKVVFYQTGQDVLDTFSGDLSELCPHKVGVLSGSYLEERLRATGCARLDSANDVTLNLRKLLGGRFPYLLESELSVRHLLAGPEFSDEERAAIAAYPTPFEIDKNYTIFSKQAIADTPELEAAMQAFDASLAAMKADGTYDTILQAHGL